MDKQHKKQCATQPTMEKQRCVKRLKITDVHNFLYEPHDCVILYDVGQEHRNDTAVRKWTLGTRHYEWNIFGSGHPGAKRCRVRIVSQQKRPVQVQVQEVTLLCLMKLRGARQVCVIIASMRYMNGKIRGEKKYNERCGPATVCALLRHLALSTHIEATKARGFPRVCPEGTVLNLPCRLGERPIVR